MNNYDLIINALRTQGKADATALQLSANQMTPDQLYAEALKVPDFSVAVSHKNMLNRKAGFTCVSPSGRVVKLLQPYDSDIFAQPPEELPAQWGFAWPNDPKYATPFVAIATSPYLQGNCCTFNGATYRVVVERTVHSPKDYPSGWEKVE